MLPPPCLSQLTGLYPLKLYLKTNLFLFTAFVSYWVTRRSSWQGLGGKVFFLHLDSTWDPESSSSWPESRAVDVPKEGLLCPVLSDFSCDQIVNFLNADNYSNLLWFLLMLIPLDGGWERQGSWPRAPTYLQRQPAGHLHFRFSALTMPRRPLVRFLAT